MQEFPGDTLPVDRSEKAAGAAAVGLTNGGGVDRTASTWHGQHSDQPTYASVRSNRTATTDTTAAAAGGYRASTAVMGSEPSMDSYHQMGSSRPVSVGAAFGTSSYSQSSTPDDKLVTDIENVRKQSNKYFCSTIPFVVLFATQGYTNIHVVRLVTISNTK
jgi:hypothetical protein